MDRAPLPDLDSLDRDALLALVRAHQEKLDVLITTRDEELRRLEAELESHRLHYLIEHSFYFEQRIQHTSTVRVSKSEQFLPELGTATLVWEAGLGRFFDSVMPELIRDSGQALFRTIDW
jgi:hypothetical protein